MTDDAEPVPDLRAWIGRTETLHDVLTPAPFAALAATLDLPCARPDPGTALPPLWHWAYFLPLHPRSALGPDGHPRRGGFLPPVALPRRMWAGGRFEFRDVLRIGDAVVRESTVEDVSEKTGRTGRLVFVRVRHDVRRADAPAPALIEHHDIVYRERPRPDERAPTTALAPATTAFERRVVPDAVLLFRYSALTFNGHRIHYDRAFATDHEGYPGLVVHGPLLATLMAELLRAERPAARLARFEYRALRPLFDGAAFDVCGRVDDAAAGRVSLWVRGPAGELAMEARATLAPDAGTQGP